MIMIKLVIFILGLTVLSAHAQEETQTQKKIQTFPTAFACFPTKFIFNDLMEKYGEEPFALGKGLIRSSQTQQFYNGSMMLWRNTSSNSWTLTITPDGDTDTSCYVISGSDFTVIDSGIKL
jgi:hypothetical protein